MFILAVLVLTPATTPNVDEGVRKEVVDARPMTFKEPVLSMVTAPLRVAMVADGVRKEVDEAKPMMVNEPVLSMVTAPFRAEIVEEVERKPSILASPTTCKVLDGFVVPRPKRVLT